MRLPFALGLLCTASAAFAADAASLGEAVAGGKIFLNLRLRDEHVQQTGLQDANALTLRTRLGFATAGWQGWKALIEAEDITAADGDSYSQSGINPGGTGRAVVADPETTEINQLLLSFTGGQTTATLGRQRLILDNARFVGDAGWRQNMQTFDAFVVQDKSLNHTTLTYAYLDQINRGVGARHPQGKWASDCHLFNASYAGLPAGTLTGYAYLLDFSNSAANSCATYGASLSGSTPLTDHVKLAYRLEAATQADYGASPLSYATHYYGAEGGLVLKSGSLTLGDEVLGSDHHVGFKTPLATLHAFNGWADLFLSTPAAGLQDTYVKATASLPGELSLLGFYHQFDTATGGIDLGHEFDLQLTRKFGQPLTALVKFASFHRVSLAYPDVQKIWAQVEFTY
jgi:hypothetical protein